VATVDVTSRQQILVLYLSTSSLASKVVGWSSFDGATTEAQDAGDTTDPPYRTGLEAMRDGWRLFQASQLLPPSAGEEYATSFQKFEFFFEKLVSGHGVLENEPSASVPLAVAR
jgi:hypothetical protein